MDRTAIEAYFSRRQREVLITQRLDPWHYRVITPPGPIDDSAEMGAWILRMRGWSIAAIARMMQETWYKAEKMVDAGQVKIEAEIGIKIGDSTT